MLVIFDLDGTLLNTLEDLMRSCNHTLLQYGFSVHPLNSYRYFVGDGMRKLCERALPENARTEAMVTRFFDDFFAHYQEHKMDFTAPYSGIIPMLEHLQQRGVQLAVASNKAHAAMDALMRHYFPTISFAAVFGKRDGVPPKPAPNIVLDILATTNAAPSTTWYVGDTATDMQTAANARLQKIGVLWGYRDKDELANAGADFIIREPSELCEIIFNS